MKTILFIHQAAELYGSDKTLLLLLKNLDRQRFNPVVILPGDGPLKEALEREKVPVVVAPVLKLYRKMLTPKGILNFIADIRKAYKILDKLHRQHRFDLVYSNTLAVLLGFFYARKRRLPHLWHVHEIIESPTVFRKAFIRLLSSPVNSVIVHNSAATSSFWSVNRHITAKSRVVLNGIETDGPMPDEAKISRIRQHRLHLGPNDTAIALVGRISRWKGQGLLLEAFSKIAGQHPHARLVYIGSAPPGQESFLYSLQEKIDAHGLQDRTTLLPFQEDIADLWQSIDIAAVPSTEPEPFGMVAIEAMIAAKPVVASAHGGLTEIIEDEVTGYLVPPGDADALAGALSRLLNNPALSAGMGVRGRQRIMEKFSVQQYTQALSAIFEEFTNV